MITDHFDSFGLNDALRIKHDDRDPTAGGASHEYRLVLDFSPTEGAWMNTLGECQACKRAWWLAGRPALRDGEVVTVRREWRWW